MKNLNEPRRDPYESQNRDQIQKTEPDVVAFERRPAGEKEAIAASGIIPKRQLEELRGRWTNIQAGFVDEPRKAVQEADALVKMAIKQIEETFSAERTELEKQWSRGDTVSTEDLRVSLQHYRSFFDRLLSRL